MPFAAYDFSDEQDLDEKSTDSVISYEDIVNDIKEETEKFLAEVTRSRGMVVPGAGVGHDDEEEGLAPMRRRKRSLDSHMPDYVKEGIWPLSQLANAEPLCAGPHQVIDLQVIYFDNADYVLCLTRRLTRAPVYDLHYGRAFGPTKFATITKLDNALKILAFVDPDIQTKLVVIVLNRKTVQAQADMIWYRIAAELDGGGVEVRERNEHNQIEPALSVFWPGLNRFVLHEREKSQLKVIEFKNNNFDHQSNLDVTADLSLVYAFSIGHHPHLLLGYRRSLTMDGRPVAKDVRLMSLGEDSKLEQQSAIAVDEEVIDAQHFIYGTNSKAENFLVLVTPLHIIFYKQLSGNPPRFFTYQRLAMANVRRVATYGDHQHLFVMAVIFQTNDVLFLTYNGYRFRPSKVQRRLYIRPASPVLFYRFWDADRSWAPHTTRMLVGRSAERGVVETYRFTFTHDDSLRHIWQESMDWCRAKRNLMMAITRRQSVVEERFSHSYLKNDPIVIRGSLTIPLLPANESVPVETREYVHHQASQEEALRVDAAYFEELYNMESTLNAIEKDVINAGHARLGNALQLNAKELQVMGGEGLAFGSLKIAQYDLGAYNAAYRANYPPVNLATRTLNGHSVVSLADDTIRLRDNRPRTFLKALHFARLDVPPSASLVVNASANGLYNLADIVTASGRHSITGRKRFHQTLVVDEDIHVKGLVNNRTFTPGTVLLTTVPQSIANPVSIGAKIRANAVKAQHVNGHHLKTLFADAVRKSETVQIVSPVEFAAGVDVYELTVNGSARLNGQSVDELMEDVLFLDRDNQSLWGEYHFHSSLAIDGHLYAERVNYKNIPEDLILANQPAVIKGPKRFDGVLVVDRLNVTSSINGLQVINGMPDIMLKYHPQNVTGTKVFTSLHAYNHSTIGGLLNGLSLQELAERSRQRTQTAHFDRLHVANFASFEGGLVFDRLNSLSRGQLDRLMTQSVGIEQSWEHLQLGDLSFGSLFVNTLNCRRINGLHLETDLLTRNTSQTITGPFVFDQLHLQAPATVQTVNNFSMSHLDEVFRTYGNQQMEEKIFRGDVAMKSLKVAGTVNDIPTEEIVFMDRLEQRTVSGVKHFRGEELTVDYLTVGDIEVGAINAIPVGELLHGTLRHSAAQNIPPHISFKRLNVRDGEDFRSLYLNGENLRALASDAVYDNSRSLQNITGAKTFTGQVDFEDITFSRLFQGITDWQMRYDWMVQGLGQKVEANFTVEEMQVLRNVHIHDGVLNGIDLHQMDRSVVRLDRKNAIHSQMLFMGQVDVEGDILLNGVLNGIDLRKDVLLSKHNGIQTVHGQVRLLGNVLVRNHLDVNGRINGVKVGQMCARMYREPGPQSQTQSPRVQPPLVINGDVTFVAPVRLQVLNNITFEELRQGTIRHDLPRQKVTGRLLVHHLVINGPQVSVERRINDVYLQEVFENYLSKTMENQPVTAEIILQGDRETVFGGDVLVHRNFYVENGILSGVDLARIDQHGLKVSGDQHYAGDVEFADVVIDAHLNAQWIDGVDTDYLMRKSRKVNSFLEETTFTRTLTVVDNLNIISGKRVAGVNIELMHNTAVQRDSSQQPRPQNFTVSGRKTFDSVIVDVIHTEKLNDVAFTKRNLLLRTDPQTVTGSLTFAGDVHLNNSVIERVNGVNLGDFGRKIAKRSAVNVIETPVEFSSLNATTVEARALVDNVNISVFNTISETVSSLESLEKLSTSTVTKFDSFKRDLTEQKAEKQRRALELTTTTTTTEDSTANEALN